MEKVLDPFEIGALILDMPKVTRSRLADQIRKFKQRPEIIVRGGKYSARWTVNGVVVDMHLEMEGN